MIIDHPGLFSYLQQDNCVRNDPMNEIDLLISRTGVDQLGVTPDMVKDLQDGTYVMIKPLMFHWTMIRGDFNDPVGYFDRWCYADRDLAERSLHDFPENPGNDYEPDGWHRHPKSGRRRENGDQDMEYLNP